MILRDRALAAGILLPLASVILVAVAGCGSGGGGGGSSAANVAGDWTGNFTANYSCTGVGSGTDGGTLDLHIEQAGSLVSGDFTIRSSAFGEMSGTLSGSVTSEKLEATLFTGSWMLSLAMSLSGGTLNGAFVAESTEPACRMNGTISTSRTS